ncbi:hypothetical protein HNP40_001414 [Mycobacteroides chelonae]|nr:hypothetical protein [Mycobacteroides chelonae]
MVTALTPSSILTRPAQHHSHHHDAERTETNATDGSSGTYARIVLGMTSAGFMKLNH